MLLNGKMSAAIPFKLPMVWNLLILIRLHSSKNGCPTLYLFCSVCSFPNTAAVVRSVAQKLHTLNIEVN